MYCVKRITRRRTFPRDIHPSLCTARASVLWTGSSGPSTFHIEEPFQKRISRITSTTILTSPTFLCRLYPPWISTVWKRLPPISPYTIWKQVWERFKMVRLLSSCQMSSCLPVIAVMNYTEMEAKVREATNNEPWGASSSLVGWLDLETSRMLGTNWC